MIDFTSIEFIAPVLVGAGILSFFIVKGMKKKEAANILTSKNEKINMRIEDSDETKKLFEQQNNSLDDLLSGIANDAKHEDTTHEENLDGVVEMILGQEGVQRDDDITAKNINVEKRDDAKNWGLFSEAIKELDKFAKENPDKTVENNNEYKYWVNWMSIIDGRATFKNNIFILKNKWGTISAIEEVKKAIMKDMGTESATSLSSFGVLSIHKIED